MRCGWVKYVFFCFFHVTCLDLILNINISRVWLILVALGYLMIINKYSPKWTWLVGLVYTAWIPKKVYFCQCTQKWWENEIVNANFVSWTAWRWTILDNHYWTSQSVCTKSTVHLWGVYTVLSTDIFLYCTWILSELLVVTGSYLIWLFGLGPFLGRSWGREAGRDPGFLWRRRNP